MFVFVGVSLASSGCGAWWLWRRRQLAAVVAAAVPVYWDDERTLCATYEDLGIARPGGSQHHELEEETIESAEPTACLDMDFLGAPDRGGHALANEHEGPEATACLDMGEYTRPAPTHEPEPTAFLDMSAFEQQPPAWVPPPPPAFEPGPGPVVPLSFGADASLASAPVFEPKHTFEPAPTTEP
jgi:hypothetical protein